MNGKKYHVVILGAGIAGLSAAIFLSKNQINDFIILNTLDNNVHKACTGLLTIKTINLINEMEIPLEGYEKIKTIKAIYNNKSVRDYSESNISLFHHNDTGRTYLDNLLFQKCISQGFQILENCKDIQIDDRNKTILCNNHQEIKFDYVIDARGFYQDINSVKYKDFGFEGKIKHDFVSIEKETSIILSDCIKGYGWIIYGKEYDVVGVVDDYLNVKKDKEYFTNFVNKHYKSSCVNIEVKGAFLPVKPSKLLINKYHAQIGDKAGLIDPLTQEGIYYAMKSGKEVALAIKNGNLLKYKKAMEEIVKSFKLAFYLRRIFFKKNYQSKLWNISSKHHFTDYLFAKYSNDDSPFFYNNIRKYHKEYKGK